MRGTLEEFIEDITPFFYGKRLTYVDTGAFTGEVYQALVNSKLNIREAHLFEPNPVTYEKLIENINNIKNTHIHNMAVGNSEGILKFKSNGSMTKVVSLETKESSDIFSINTNTLDNFAESLTEKHISLLKIDVEGFEKEVLEGARNILSNQQVDMVYVEAGMSKDNLQQCYYRDIDDILTAHGYRVFRIYEQMFEWMDDSPFLRRVNFAYMSPSFAKANPFRLANEIFELSEKFTSSKLELKLLSSQLKTTNKANELLQDQLLQATNTNESLDSELTTKTKSVEVLTKENITFKENYKSEKKQILEQVEILKEAYTKQFLTQTKNRQEIVQLEENVAKIKLQLSYRLGAVFVNNSKSLFKILSIPKKAFKAYRDFKEYILYKNNASFEKVVNTELSNNLILPLSNRWYPTKLIRRENKESVHLQALSSEPKECFEIEIKIFPIPENSFALNVFGESITIHEKVIVRKAMVGSKQLTKFLQSTDNLPPKINISFRNCSNNNVLLNVFLKPENKNQLLSKTTSVNIYPKAQASAILMQAKTLMDQGYVNEGIEFASKYAKGNSVNAVELLKANRDINNEKEWLKRINNYLRQFNIVPIKLTNKMGVERFHRITANCDYSIDEGPLVSILMPAFNAEKYIEHSIYSILNQTWKNIELIVIDDCSTDSTWQIISTIAAQDSRLHLIKNKVNVGPYVSKNYGLELSKGIYITGHDADDWAHPQRIEKHVNVMLGNKKLKASINRMVRMSKDGSIAQFSKIGKTSDDGATRIASISCMIEKEFLTNTLGYWDCARFGADSEIIARIEKVAGNEAFTNVRQLSMICLDAEGSLTNNPTTGVSKVTGISPTRKYYRDQWLEWHKSITQDNAYLNFPHHPRKFGVSDEASVSIVDVENNLNESNYNEISKLG